MRLIRNCQTMNLLRRRYGSFPFFVFLLFFGTCLVFYLIGRSSRMMDQITVQGKLTFSLVGLETQQSSSRTMKPNAWSKKIPVDCNRLIDGEKEEIARSEKIMSSFPKKKIPNKYYARLKDCDAFKNNRSYIMKVSNKSEQEFPIAYGIAIYKDIEQFERLLRAIYRPQNYYCVHVDSKSPKRFHRAAKKISSCFPNVFLASRFVDVQWGSFTVLEAYLICLEDLLARYGNWKYFINLAGQEFPLKTNSELVTILKSMNGRSFVEGYKPKDRRNLDRYRYVYQGAKRTTITKRPFAYQFTYFKGSAYVALSRDFANFSLNSHVGKEFLEYVKDTGHPDEGFLPTLLHNGVFPTPATSGPENPIATFRYVNWSGKNCYGKRVRSVCIHGVGALKLLTNRPEPFVNKFHLDYQYLALDCMEQWLYNKTLSEMSKTA